MPLTEPELARFGRQLLLPDLSEAGQERLRAARVRVVGAGPLGGAALLYLAEAGVGSVLVDDVSPVAFPQDAAAWLFTPDDAGSPRQAGALAALARASHFVSAAPFVLGAPHDAVLVCADEPDLAMRAAEEARTAGLPCVVAQVQGDGGAVTVIPRAGPCLACATEAPLDGRGDPGAFAALGALAALQLVLFLSGVRTQGRRIDLVRGRPMARPILRRPGCACGNPRGA